MRRSLCLLALVALAACASKDKPVTQMIYGSAALRAAERAGSEKKSPDLYRRAENKFSDANRYYLAKEYKEAAKSAVESMRLAEQAELDAEVKDAASTSNEGG